MHLLLAIFLKAFMVLMYCSTLSGFGTPSYQKLSPRELFKFRSYKDVQLFHFQVPDQVKLAKFSFRANETNTRCDPKNVTIYLQYGSYPVMSPLGAEFPDNFYLSRTSLVDISSRSDSTWLRYSTAAPLPGDWFAAAFTLYDDTRITQKGLGPSCHTVLESEAHFESQEEVITLVPEVTAHQTLILTQKITTTQYYRFVVPEGTFAAVVNVSKCVEAAGGGPCPLTLSASPLTLPADGGPLTRSVNCSGGSGGGASEGVCLLPLNTAPDRWHYVRLALADGVAAQFGIQIVLDSACVGEDRDNEYMLVSEMRCQSPARTAFIPVMFSDDSALGNDSCDWDRVPLGRQSLAGSLAFIYDQLPDPDTNKPPRLLNISTERPTYLAFDVQPVQDIGGTLTVALTLPSSLNTTAANVSVTGCLSHWVRARVLDDGTCSTGIRLSVNTTTTVSSSSSSGSGGGRKDNVTNLPYPEPGDWYLTLAVRCYHQQLHARATPSVPCPENETSLVFHVESAPCLQASCGTNGACYQYFSGGCVFSTCVCWAGKHGYAGWGCTDSSHATPDFQLLLATLLLTISNVLFAPAIILALRRRYYTEAFVYAFTMFFSTFYHACDEQKYVYCLMRLSLMQFCDFYSGIFAFWVTLVCMADLAPTWSSLLNVSGAMLVALGVEYDRTGLWVFVAPVATAFVCMFASWVFHCRRQRVLFPSLRYLLLGLLPGATVAGVGLICYALLETEDNYKYTHSAWHCCIAVSILFLLPPRREQAGSYSLQSGGASAGKLLRVSTDGSQQTVNTSEDSERGVADGHR